MNLKELGDKMSGLKNWALESGGMIVKDVEFDSFKETMDFVNKVAEVAEKIGHHPSIIIDYTRVKLILTTHDLGGLGEKDFLMAEEIDKL